MTRLAAYLNAIQISSLQFKAAITFIETMRVRNKGIKLRPYHVQRLYDSCVAYGCNAADMKGIINDFNKAVDSHLFKLSSDEDYKLRCTLLLQVNGAITFDFQISKIIAPFKLVQIKTCIAETTEKIEYGQVFKTTNRAIYDKVLQNKEAEVEDMIIINNGVVMDTLIGNIVIWKNGCMQTPSLNSGCVAGCMLQAIMDYGRQNGWNMQEALISKKDLLEAETIWVVNALRGIMVLEQIDQQLFSDQYALQRINIINSIF